MLPALKQLKDRVAAGGRGRYSAVFMSGRWGPPLHASSQEYVPCQNLHSPLSSSNFSGVNLVELGGDPKYQYFYKLGAVSVFACRGSRLEALAGPSTPWNSGCSAPRVCPHALWRMHLHSVRLTISAPLLSAVAPPVWSVYPLAFSLLHACPPLAVIRDRGGLPCSLRLRSV